MEIYHRDHWIMIVYMAIWKDLTILNEENTIIDWIIHMGRIVKSLRACGAKALRMNKITWYYIMYYFISYQAVSGYTRL